MDVRKNITTLLLGCSTLFTAVTAHSFDFFAANRYDELAALPSSSLGAPSGLVSGWGSAFVAFGGLANTSSSDRTDASLAAGFGLGDPINSVGSVVSLSVGSVSPDGGAGERGALGASIGKFFVGPQLGVAIGGINLAGWNDITTKPDPSAYLAVTKIFPIEDHPIIVNVGIGTNAFADIREADPEDEVGAFVSAAFYLTPHISLIADYTSSIVTLGTSILPVSDFPLIITLGAFDVNERTPGSDGTSFIGSVAYSFMF
jgi:hypothetical protein